jgi:hypothetical protein
VVTKPDKAKITVFGSDGSSEELDVMFNPEELSFGETVEYGTEGSELQFTGTKKDDFKVSLFFDTYESDQKDVRDVTEKFTDIVQPTSEGVQTSRPPECLFTWGKFRYKGNPKKIDQKFTMFLSDGTPVRATIGLTLTQSLTHQEAREAKGQNSCRRMRVVKEGERLDLIAYKELKNPAQWRRIAHENKITDPLKFPKEADRGKAIIIPD